MKILIEHINQHLFNFISDYENNNLFDKGRLSYNRCYSKIVRGIFQFQARYKGRIDESPISIDKKDKFACHRVSFAKSYLCIVVDVE